MRKTLLLLVLMTLVVSTSKQAFANEHPPHPPLGIVPAIVDAVLAPPPPPHPEPHHPEPHHPEPHPEPHHPEEHHPEEHHPEGHHHP